MTDNSRRQADGRPRPISLPSLYAIVDVDLCAHRALDPRLLADALVAGGARLLQVRQKGNGSGSFLDVARDIVARARPRGCAVIVNDRADLAVIAGADGVHVGQQDLPVHEVRPIVGPEAIVGLSTHTEEQIDEALGLPVDYIAVGPVYRTATKDTGYDPRGLELIRFAAGRGKPIVGIGGISLDNCVEVLAAGATSIAVISDLLAGGDPESRVRRYLRILNPAF